MMAFTNRVRSYAKPALWLRVVVLLVALIGASAQASDSAFQFYFGGLDDVPAGAAGILVADQDGNGFLEPDSDYFDGVKLEAGRTIGPWNNYDRIIAVFAATDSGFGAGKTGFTGVVNRFKFDWRDRVPVGVPLKFYWFADAKPGDRLGRWMRYGSFRRDAMGTSGGTSGFFSPDFRKHETIAAICNNSPGGGDFDGVTGVNIGFVGVGDFTGEVLPERIEDPQTPATDPSLTDSALGDEFRGTYVGLVSDTATGSNLGEVSIRVGGAGRFSGRLIVNRVRFTLRGTFDEAGNFATIVDSRQADEPLDVVLQLATTDGSAGLKITGTVDGESGLAGVIDSHRSSFHPRLNPAPQGGQYTMLLPKTEDSVGGDGYALVTVRTNGRITARFRLGDYATASDATYLSVDGEWPLSLAYASRKLGSLAGKLTFRDILESDFDGVLDWSKQAHPRQKFFPEGFETEITAIGSEFIRVTEGRILPDFSGGWRNAAISFVGGDLAPNPGTIFAGWESNNRFSPRIGEEERLRISANARTGLVSGSYVNKAESSAINIRFSGVAFQKQSLISGVASQHRTTNLAPFSLYENP
jgi:hypothetical protein